uniref:Fumarate lyase (AspA) n=1 Tax=uncultured marine thaumarchaeote KM3_84_F11 TaxID=1456314 RepID=A0A075HTR4_9ARCH|nr:fumarate lyase (aspA) [uncultured marine thaumarchaeote KM3_84_F11]
MRSRSDRDSLGTVQIPSDAYYGPFTGRAIKQYQVTGQKPHPYLIKSFVMIKRSAAIANMKTKSLDRKRGNAIVKACDKIIVGKHQDQFVVDMINSGAGTAFNMNTNEVIANVALKILGKKLGQYEYLHPNDHVNMSQSSNDTFPTAMHVTILFAIRDMLPVVDKLNSSLRKKAKQFSSYKKVGRTHLMDALPVTLGSEFASYATALTVARDGIISTKKELEKLALGGTAVGTGANAPKGYRTIAIRELSKISKLSLKPQQDMQYSLQSRYAVANMSSALKNYSVDLGKVANDIRLMASGPIAGLSELGIPAVHAGSSIMPGKVNPSLAECMNMICYSVIGNDTTVTLATQAGQFELNVMLPVMLKSVLDSTDMLTNFLPIFAANLIDGLTSNKKNFKSTLKKAL